MFQDKVKMYVDQFGYSPKDAEAKAAEVTRSRPLEYSSSPGLSTLEVVGIVLGVGLIVLVVFAAIALSSWKGFVF
jgi:hypothetical protein